MKSIFSLDIFKRAFETKYFKPNVVIFRGFYSLFRRHAQTFEVIIPICITVIKKKRVIINILYVEMSAPPSVSKWYAQTS